MQEADSERGAACRSSTPNVKVELESSYLISLAMIALFENVNQMTRNKLQQGGGKSAHELQYFESICYKRHFEPSPT